MKHTNHSDQNAKEYECVFIESTEPDICYQCGETREAHQPVDELWSNYSKIETVEPELGVIERLKDIESCLSGSFPATHKIKVAVSGALAELRNLRQQRDELHRLWDASAAEARRNKAERDELLAAAKRVEHSWHITRRKTLASSMAHLRAAIAKADGTFAAAKRRAS